MKCLFAVLSVLTLMTVAAVQPASAQPNVTSVVNAANYRAASGVVLGAQYTAFGTNLSGGSVQVSGQNAYVTYSGGNQINFVMPTYLPSLTGYIGPAALVVVTVNGVASNQFYAGGVIASDPAMYGCTPSSPWFQEPNGTLVGDCGYAAAPGMAGNYFTLYGNAFAAPPNGCSATVVINGVSESVTYCGPQGGGNGEWQINIQLSATVAPGTASAQLTINGHALSPVGLTFQ
jgi:uncharacterized protein (TIGR03437 family)